MKKISKISEYLQSFISSKRLGKEVVYHEVFPKTPPFWKKPKKQWPKEINKIIYASGVQKLYSHQAQAVDHIRKGRHVVVATPTASGKTLIYTLPVLENILKNPGSKALYIFPLKALAQDQLRTFEEMTAKSTLMPTAAIYDGDTSAWHRKRIREMPPNVLMTNPEMLHLSLLPYHEKWASFFSGLDIVVVDEVHTYRGVMGSNMALVFRRFQRICSFYGVSPTFIFSSATIANPTQLIEQLTGLKAKTITKSGAPLGKRNILFVNPIEGPARTAILLLKAALHRGLRTIVYTQSRKLTELIAIWAGSQSGPFANRISAYRAGFLPEERREIEKKLAKGDLLAVISTSALELGIDIGDLDLCLLVGYPGSVVATWQRGGRVGRSGQDSALVLIAGEDALDQFFIHNPEDFIKREPEAAVINPYNPEILARHLVCAAAELPIKNNEKFLSEEPVLKSISSLEKKGDLLKSADGKEFFSSRKFPQRYINLRGTGSRFNIVSGRTGQSKGEIDGFRAFKETHPGAIYLHKGDTYLVNNLDMGTMTIKVSKAKVDYYTRVRSDKKTDILEVFEEKPVWGTSIFMGQLKVTEQVTGYEKWSIHTKKRLNIIPLDLPPQIFETDGLWFKIPLKVQEETISEYLHFMGGIHALEHAAIGIFPLLVMTDRNDLGGISTPYHNQVKSAAIFIYDGVPGGAGLSRQAFSRSEELLEYTMKTIVKCPCESGCPSCVHSPKCGSGNRPIDKTAAIFILERIQDVPKPDGIKTNGVYSKAAKGRYNVSVAERSNSLQGQEEQRIALNHVQDTSHRQTKKADLQNIHFGVFDIETQRSAQEVGGWHRADLMGISCAVLYDSKKDTFFEFLEDQVPMLIEHMRSLDLIVGFNIKRFDYHVLDGYSEFDFRKLPTLDILEEIHKHLGYRLSLDHLARVNLKIKKSADGLQALRWWKQGRISEIIDYCKHDVAITRDLFILGKKNKYLLFNNKAGNTVRIPVRW